MLEANGIRFLEEYPKVKQMLQQAWWLEFVEKFNDHEKEATIFFSRAYDDIKVEIGDVKLVLTESFIAKATRFQRIG